MQQNQARDSLSKLKNIVVNCANNSDLEIENEKKKHIQVIVHSNSNINTISDIAKVA